MQYILGAGLLCQTPDIRRKQKRHGVFQGCQISPFLRSSGAVFLFDVFAQLVLSTSNWLRLPQFVSPEKRWGQNTGHIVMLGKAGDIRRSRTQDHSVGVGSKFPIPKFSNPKSKIQAINPKITLQTFGWDFG